MDKIKWSHWRKVAKRLFIEGRFPLLIAIGWTIWSNWGNVFSKEGLSSFISCLTAMVFLFGNVFRVDHKVSQEETLGDIAKRSTKLISDLEALSLKLEDQTRKIVGFATGGDTKAEFEVSHIGATNTLVVSFANKGEFPVYDVVSRLLELSDSVQIGVNGSYGAAVSHPVLRPSVSVDAYFLSLSGVNSGKWRVSLQTRNNHSSSLMVRAAYIDGVFKYAARWSYGGGIWEHGGDLAVPGFDSGNSNTFFTSQLSDK